MSSARAVSHIIVDAGVNAIMSKLDKKDAYKLIPAKTEDLRLQGFSLLGKFFVETQQIFGSQKAVENFDRLGNTIHRISVIESGIDPAIAPRQLDDVVCVSPAKSGNCKRFTDVFIKTAGNSTFHWLISARNSRRLSTVRISGKYWESSSTRLI
jgi:hypothetical protein